MKELLIAVTICNPVSSQGSGVMPATYKKFFDVINKNTYHLVAG